MSRPSTWLLPLLLLLSSCLFSQVYAWNRVTHMVTGAIAYREMQQASPQLAERVIAILRQHPEYQQRWAAKLNDPSLSADDRNQYLFMLAARWPDDIRGNQYDHPTWHYVNYIYAPEQGIARTDTVLSTDENILQAYETNRQILRSNAPDSAKDIALCWMFHLTGDVHQPLHASALVDKQFSKGDRGGNLFEIKVMMNSQTIDWHSFGDIMLLGSDDFQSVRNLTVLIRQREARNQLPQLGKKSITD